MERRSAGHPDQLISIVTLRSEQRQNQLTVFHRVIIYGYSILYLVGRAGANVRPWRRFQVSHPCCVAQERKYTVTSGQPR